MNLPNKLTILRVIMIPFFLFFLLSETIAAGKWIAVALFVLASLTDMLDGKIARKYNLITNFGKFMDPLADKLLVCSAIVALISLERIPCWVVIVIIAREFIISGFRLVASDNGVVIAAGWWGKIKTVVQMIMTIVLICDFGAEFSSEAIPIIENILIYAALALTVISLIDYLYKNKDVLKEQK
ncbi:MAG: CDP-diacylglycerol--glycerol-3-phosphate 3-phosphatidyltransferase [Eubacteriales bacterium]|nr:CDP-diacylglycerol--glycerol-3-phosphate 3-phosphatidyltransferase [Lachnospiraceae bacterium]MDO5127072.1 CDP-diacylglycerol--glycerol-3-phosphate 3-phosphatidyltransferase [Eubacteriales bacterium]